MSGPLHGIRIVEISAVGPVALFATIMADLGATVIRVDRPSHFEGRKEGAHVANRPVVDRDLKQPESVAFVLDLVRGADVLIEGYRPGVMERLGLGPDVCLAANPKLVFARMTGWGQQGPFAGEPGHDINYLALTGALAAIGTEQEPIPPLNLIADYGGGSMFACVGVLAALLSALRSGKGQVIDVAMIDGVGSLFSMQYERYAQGLWNNARRTNTLDGAAPYYGCYPCKDGKWVAAGALEMKFRRAMANTIGVPELGEESSSDPASWPQLRTRVAEAFKTATRDEWMERMYGRETCCTPILDMDEAPHHPHNVARTGFFQDQGGWVPSPAPRFSATPAERKAPRTAEDVLKDFAAAAGTAPPA
ncbi:L-carnitine dehydratase/bile acid-inducible protein F [Rhizorhabdus wittichii RW1]|uniref:L-carnitine dehydratase/bile acid-inducible protein F n=1 Tax=Rhizorhabdus wittichii (strain DSM 6014 / CCUG 31198 / JCM 15750 / NBRC 105917 / EY 4224 / RW1) TaxID=392499 RepID=A0A9J9HBD8_RHIWR|nr:L-carnitine dehydratase/bile acid-inducible protein F [Rhizorhabdus wittichii RW1]